MPRTSILLDACVAINLAATDRLQHIAEATSTTFTLVRQAATEVGHLRDIAEGNVALTPIDLSQYDRQTLEIISLTPPEYPIYVNLAQSVDDGEAATIAVAVQRNLRLATDDRKARRLCTELQIPEPLRTLGLLRSYADATRLQYPQLRSLLLKIRDRASYQPPRSDPDQKWWEGIINDV